MEKKKLQVPHTFVLLFIMILLVCALTWIIPAGEYERIENEAGRTIVVDDSYKVVESNKLNLWDATQAVYKGLKEASSIVIFVLLIGGAFEILNETRALEAGIYSLTKKLGKMKFLIVVALGFVFGLGGATIGLAEELIVFIPLGLMISTSFGYDRMVGFSMIYLSAMAGFSAGFLNPFTVGVAQGISGLPAYSGLTFRIIVWLALFAVTVSHILLYARKTTKNPTKSVLHGVQFDDEIKTEEVPFTTTRILVLLSLVGILSVMVYGIMKDGWYLTEIASIFLALGIIAGLIARYNPSKIAQLFIKGAKGIIFGAMVVGVARGILVVLEQGLIMDTLINTLVTLIKEIPESISVLGMYLTQCIINFFIPSGSGQAAVTMPIMSSVSDLIGVNRQVAVLAYQFGDGFTNIIIPTSGTLMATLSVAKIPYEKWVKFVIPILLKWIGVGVIALIIANMINLGPF